MDTKTSGIFKGPQKDIRTSSNRAARDERKTVDKAEKAVDVVTAEEIEAIRLADATNPGGAEAAAIERAAAKKYEESGSKVDPKLEGLAVALEIEANTAQNHGIKAIANNLRDLAEEVRSLDKK